MNAPFSLTRRQFLVRSLSTGAGLTLALYLPGCGREPEADTGTAGPGQAGARVAPEAEFEPNAFVRILPDDRVEVVIKHLEMGQGTFTGLATLVAEELDADWSQIVPVPAPADPERYNNLNWGKLQGTGGSTAIANAYTQMRQAGATARHMLVQAAVAEWGVPASEIRVSKGELSHPDSGRTARFGELAAAAAAQPVPEEVLLKEPGEFTLIGTFLPRLDNAAKLDGSAVYTQDIQLPGMRVAVVAHPPRFGARVKAYDAAAAKQVKGVTEVVGIPTGVAVLADNTWSAIKGREALKVEWDESAAFRMSSREILDDYRGRAQGPAAVARSEGDAAAALERASTRLTAAMHMPYLAHAAMEPLNCVMQLTEDGCEIWNGEQFQTVDQQNVAQVLGLEPGQVKINMLYAGGSFGRRANPHSDYLVETAHIVKSASGKAPVKLVWTREDDMLGGYYRPFYYHELEAGLDGEGMPVAWRHRIVGQSIMTGTVMEGGMVRDGVDATSVEGAANLPYAIPNLEVDLVTTELPVTVQWWRSVGSTHTAFAVETFIDRLARAAGRDPVDYRRGLLKDHPRHLGVLELAAQKAGWGRPLPEGRARGVAVHESFNSYVAEVAEVSIGDNGRINVERVVIAVDCGVAVNPDNIRAQMEGGMAFGLAAALMSEITLEDGQVVQSNFDGYEVLGIDRMPVVEVHIVPSTEPPTGVGEPATPVIAPAVANALSVLTGQDFDRLPLQLAV
ncbi:isoquinoline 1-oxidoreductase, beta subunit [Thiohalobacter thiocyanaticus]|uniref:Isoquinoline 1-oxidoreductase, beta subunit n=1 Tax=Thiohalobacter thiocyanaticus TaxID=585455 RepID=A0A1Z4VTR8_9GAMM|nr:xanthine dehydrogenase family protein molybdopterin-binding subunit [Thiohalobacter thiocyanaticus]BAZ94728.1 isoquinoline 1-oxidoreductase, beta subunit [Thiohalobacter thiocyanaticus]